MEKGSQEFSVHGTVSLWAALSSDATESKVWMEFKDKMYMDDESYTPNEDYHALVLSHLEAMQFFTSKSKQQNVGTNMVHLEMLLRTSVTAPSEVATSSHN